MVNARPNERSACGPDTGWKALYRVGGAAVLVAVAFFRRNYGTELVTFRGFGIWQGVPEVIPVRAVDWFSLLQRRWFVGLNLMGLRDLVNYCLVGLFFLALGAALWRVSKGAIVVAVAATLVGT